MALTFTEGQRVEIVDREANDEDVKSGLFYNFFRGLTGTVQKVYTSDEIAVEVEQASLPEAAATRHHEIQEAMKSRWLDGLSEEARNRLTDAEKDFKLRYTLLVHSRDLKEPSKEAPVLAARPTSEDLTAAEQAYLDSRKASS